MFVGNSTIEECKFVHHLNTSDAQCEFVKQNLNCQDVGGFINYIQVLYCDFPGQLAYLAIFLYALWLIVLFIGLAISADDYFCPNLAIISKTLRLSHNIAGVTILAFGNGAPDIFSSMAGVTQSRPELVLGALFGAGVFVTTAVAGSVCVSKPFKLMERPFLRDVTFYLAAGFWAFCIFYRGEIRLYDSLGFLALYLVYILVVIIGRLVNQRLRQREAQAQLVTEDNDEGQDEVDDDGPTLFIPHHRHNRHPSDSSATYRSWIDPSTMSVSSSIIPDTPDAPVPSLDTIATPMGSRLKAWHHLAHKLNPVSEWTGLSIPKKLWQLLKAPVVLVLTITVPVVDEEQHRGGWCQYLHAIQLLLAPQFVLLATGLSCATIPVDSMSLWQLAVMASLASIIVLLCSSDTQVAPVYQAFLSFIGFMVAVVWIYVIANEIVALLKAAGVYFGLSDAILGLTVLAWGNSIGDLIADVAIAKQGYPRMGFSACFGGPLFNLLLGIGLPFTIAIVKNGGYPISVDYNNMVLVLSASLAVALVTSFIIMPLSKFKATKAHGVGLITLYVLLLTAALIIEFSVLT